MESCGQCDDKLAGLLVELSDLNVLRTHCAGRQQRGQAERRLLQLERTARDVALHRILQHTRIVATNGVPRAWGATVQVRKPVQKVAVGHPTRAGEEHPKLQLGRGLRDAQALGHDC
eukprot:6437742-Prymnesium_polylepis.1